MIPLLILLFRRYISLRRKVPHTLFQEALGKENSGHFEMALLTYEQALSEVNKRNMQGSILKTRILEKLKTLQTVIAYNNGFITGVRNTGS